MESKDLFNLLHNAVEAQHFGKKISQKEMADRLGISMRTYQDWKLGRTNPQAALVIFKMLSELEEEDIVRVVKKVSKVLKNDNNTLNRY
jgi:transcriptional regulator with XRE-family HTH domain